MLHFKVLSQARSKRLPWQRRGRSLGSPLASLNCWEKPFLPCVSSLPVMLSALWCSPHRCDARIPLSFQPCSSGKRSWLLASPEWEAAAQPEKLPGRRLPCTRGSWPTCRKSSSRLCRSGVPAFYLHFCELALFKSGAVFKA